MLETPHVIVAAAIAAKTGNPLLAVSLSFLSHFVLDKTPHWNPHLTTSEVKIRNFDRNTLFIVITDSLAALIAGLLIAMSFLPDQRKFLLVIMCSFVAILPDLIEAPYIFLNKKSSWAKKWLSFQKRHQNNTNVVWGIATQVLVIIGAMGWILQK